MFPDVLLPKFYSSVGFARPRGMGKHGGMTAVHCDYFRDLRDILATRLSADGFQVETQDDHDTLLVRFLNVAQRMIPTQARRVKWSSELRGRELSLDPTVRKVLAEIER